MRRVVRTSNLTPGALPAHRAAAHDGGRHTFGIGSRSQAAPRGHGNKGSMALSLSIRRDCKTDGKAPKTQTGVLGYPTE